jgi:PKD repeat protein
MAYTIEPSKDNFTFTPSSRSLNVRGMDVTGQDFATSISITLTSPNGGEVWGAGRTNVVRWSYTGEPGPSVTLLLLQNGKQVAVLGNTTHPIGEWGYGSYTWNTGATWNGADFQIRIFCGTYQDTSDDYFTIIPSPPSADFTAFPTSDVAPLVVQFTNTSKGDITSYDWDFGDKTTSTLQSPTHTYNTPGVYTVSLKATAPGGSNTKTRENYISVSPFPTIRVRSPNGGEAWELATTKSIRWTYTGHLGDFVRIVLIKDGYGEVATISSGAPVGTGGTGSYRWSIPSALTSGDGYKIGLASTKYEKCTDMSDGFFALSDAQPPILPKVRIVPIDGTASEKGRNIGKFKITRTGDTSEALTVRYTVSGSATNGEDYKRLSGSKLIQPGESSTTIIITPVNDTSSEGVETVEVRIRKKSTYKVGSPETAVAIIEDND